MGLWLAIDHGTRRIGVAAGSTSDGIASPIASVPAEPFPEAIENIRRLACDYKAVGIVVGWPLNMDDTEGPQAALARHAAERIRDALGMDVRMWDERLSSFAADRILAGSLTRKKRKNRQDAIAAATFLQDFLSSGGPESAPTPDELAGAD